MTTGYAGGDTRFQVLARVYNVDARPSASSSRPTCPTTTSRVDTWVRVYAGADWHEREAWEMFGIDFDGHPHLRHIYLPGEFEGHPLRKDFPLLARRVKPWPGIVDVEPMPGGTTSGDADGRRERGRRMTAVSDREQLAYIAAQAADAPGQRRARDREA